MAAQAFGSASEATLQQDMYGLMSVFSNRNYTWMVAAVPPRGHKDTVNDKRSSFVLSNSSVYRGSDSAASCSVLSQLRASSTNPHPAGESNGEAHRVEGNAEIADRRLATSRQVPDDELDFAAFDYDSNPVPEKRPRLQEPRDYPESSTRPAQPLTHPSWAPGRFLVATSIPAAPLGGSGKASSATPIVAESFNPHLHSSHVALSPIPSIGSIPSLSISTPSSSHVPSSHSTTMPHHHLIATQTSELDAAQTPVDAHALLTASQTPTPTPASAESQQLNSVLRLLLQQVQQLSEKQHQLQTQLQLIAPAHSQGPQQQGSLEAPQPLQ